jgi:hypothetical protein
MALASDHTGGRPVSSYGLGSLTSHPLGRRMPRLAKDVKAEIR